MAEEKKKTESTKLTKLIEEIGSLSVLELADLVKALEEKFGVSPAAMAVSAAVPAGQTSAPAGAPATPAGAQPGAAPEAAQQTTFNVVLTSAGANKISVIKMVREINQNLGLKEAKDLVESLPKEVLTSVNKQTAEEAKKKLEEVGATVELK